MLGPDKVLLPDVTSQLYALYCGDNKSSKDAPLSNSYDSESKSVGNREMRKITGMVTTHHETFPSKMPTTFRPGPPD